MNPMLLKLSVLGAGLLLAGYALDIDVGRLVAGIQDQSARAIDDAGALASGERSRQVAARLAAAAAEPESGRPESPSAADDEMRRELAAERQRLLKEKAARAERLAGDIVAGNLESVKRQAAENARVAGRADGPGY